jgi:excisionase family DNA binding protein
MEQPREFTIHPLMREEPGYFFISDSDGGSMYFAENEIPIIIDLLKRYQQGQHDGPRPLLLNDSMTVEEVSKTYGIQSGTVRRTIWLGKLPARKSGKNWLIKYSDAEARWGEEATSTKKRYVVK